MEPADSGQALYLTAFVRVLHFRDDPYERDRRAMAGPSPPAAADGSVCQEPEKLGS